jgi:tetratricopeptide (TPR) repeat protein
MWFEQEEACVEVCRKRIAVCESLVADVPTKPEYQRRLAKAYHELGTVLGHFGHAQEMEKAFRRSVALWNRLHQDFPNLTDNDTWDRAATLNGIGVSLTRQHRYEEAAPFLRQGLQIRRKLAANDPDHSLNREGLSSSLRSLADLYQGWGKLHQAETFLRESLSLNESLVAAFPSIPAYQRGLTNSYGRLGRLMVSMGRTDEAEEAFRRSVLIAETLVEEHPDTKPFPQTLGNQYYLLGTFLYESGQVAEGVDMIRQGMELLEVHAQDDVAWLLVTCPAKQFRDPERAIALAKKELQHEPLSASVWGILALAQMRSGKLQEASESVQQSMELSSGGNSLQWYGMAMLKWQQDEKLKAKEWYDRAVEWMDNKAPNDLEMRGLRDEAARLLGIDRDEVEQGMSESE